MGSVRNYTLQLHVHEIRTGNRLQETGRMQYRCVLTALAHSDFVWYKLMTIYLFYCLRMLFYFVINPWQQRALKVHI